jgi:hypothetical protein
MHQQTLEDVLVPPPARPLYATRLNRCTKVRASFSRGCRSNRFQRLPTSVRLRGHFFSRLRQRLLNCFAVALLRRLQRHRQRRSA